MPISLGGGANPDKLYLNGRYHSAAYLGSELVWRKKPNPPTLAANNEWYKSAQAKDTITRITICVKYTPAGVPDEMWDASAKQDNSITVYRYGTELIIAGNGAERIYANASSVNAFRDLKSCAAFDGLSVLDTSQVISMYGLFENCASITELDVSKWDTSCVTNMKEMFLGCSSLVTLDVSKWDTVQVKGLDFAFRGCSSLTALDMSKWDTTQVTNMRNVFFGTNRLSSVILGSKFTFVDADGYLPTPSASYISGADGKWYDTADGVGYTPAELAAVVRTEPRTYVAAKPEN